VVQQSQILSLKQSQNLVMTASMQQSLKILQMSSLELAEMIESELEANPLLEKDDNTVTEETPVSNEIEGESEASADNENSFEEEYKTGENDIDEDIGDAWNTSENYDNYENSGGGKGDNNNAGSVIERIYSEQLTLKDHLLDQIALDLESQKEKIIASHLVDMLDGNGYLIQDNFDEEIKNLSEKIGCSVNDIMALIPKLQKLDPCGVFARNLKDCLKIQLAEQNRLDPCIGALIDNLELLAKGELSKLKKLCNSDEENLKEMIREVKSLNPRPAINFNHDLSQTKIPDLFLNYKDGKFSIELNYDFLPKIFLCKDVFKQNRSKNTAQDKKFFSDKVSSGNFLIRAIAQRAETMLKVANIILEKQLGFFEKGINFLKPLIMKEVADEAGIHESTVGRVVANKYISTPRGVYELRYFFTQSLGGTYSDDLFSSETAKHKIKELIEGEKSVLSDDEISMLLKREGINIARRTVAKYREAMQIPTSSKRKRSKRVNL